MKKSGTCFVTECSYMLCYMVQYINLLNLFTIRGVISSVSNLLLRYIEIFSIVNIIVKSKEHCFVSFEYKGKGNIHICDENISCLQFSFKVCFTVIEESDLNAKLKSKFYIIHFLRKLKVIKVIQPTILKGE